MHGAPQFQQTLLECLTEAALDGVIVIDAEGRIVALNQRFADLWGLSPQAVQARDRAAVTARIIEQLARPPGLRLPQRLPPRAPPRGGHQRAHPARRAHGGALQHPHLGHRRAGRAGRGAGRAKRAGRADGDFYGRLGWYRDVTDRTRAEATLRASRDELDAILRGVADGVTVQDETGRFVYANAAAADMAGFASPEAFLGATAGEVSAPPGRPGRRGAPVPLQRPPRPAGPAGRAGPGDAGAVPAPR